MGSGEKATATSEASPREKLFAEFVYNPPCSFDLLEVFTEDAERKADRSGDGDYLQVVATSCIFA